MAFEEENVDLKEEVSYLRQNVEELEKELKTVQI